MPTQTRSAKRKHSVASSFADKRLQPSAAASNYRTSNTPVQHVRTAAMTRPLRNAQEPAFQQMQLRAREVPYAAGKLALKQTPRRTAANGKAIPGHSRGADNVGRPAESKTSAAQTQATMDKEFDEIGDCIVVAVPAAYRSPAADKGKTSPSSSASAIIPAQIPHQPTSAYVQIHERFDAQASGPNTLPGKIRNTRDPQVRQMLVQAESGIKQDLETDQQRCLLYIESEYKQICNEDLPYLQRLKRKILDDVWSGKRYKANVTMLQSHINRADKIYAGMRSNISACMAGDAFQQSAFSMRLQGFRAGLDSVKTIQATLEAIQRRSCASSVVRPLNSEPSLPIVDAK